MYTNHWQRVFSLVVILLTAQICQRIYAQEQSLAGSVPVVPPIEEQKSPAPKQLHSWSEGETLTGNWEGIRSALLHHGVEPFGYYTAIASGNPRGGYSQGHVTAVDDIFFGVRLNLGSLVHWPGASVTISGINRDGRGLTNQYIKSQYNVQQTVGGQNLFFYQLFLKKSFNDNKMSFKVGRFSASDDLNASPLYGLYLNNGIDGDIRNVLFNTQFSAYPFATWAAHYRADFESGVNLQVGVFQTWKDIFQSELNGVDWTIHDGDGIIAMTQAGVTTHLRKKDPPAAARKRLEGHYWLGATYSPWKGYKQFLSKDLASNSYGFYAHGDQKVWESSPGSKKSLTLWGTVGYYPQQNIAIVPLQATIGLVHQGLIAKRPEDKTVFAFLYGQFSRDYAKQQRLAAKGSPSYEGMLEAGHRFQLSKSFFLQPDLQWVIRPGGTAKYRNAVVAGAEIGVTF